MNKKLIGILILILGVILLFSGLWCLMFTDFMFSIVMIFVSMVLNIAGINVLLYKRQDK